MLYHINMSEVGVSDSGSCGYYVSALRRLGLVCHLFILFFISLSLLVIGIASSDVCHIMVISIFVYNLYISVQEHRYGYHFINVGEVIASFPYELIVLMACCHLFRLKLGCHFE